MLYYLFQYLQENFNLPGAGVFQFISFRVAIALIFSLLISLVYGKRIIRLLQKKQMGEQIRELGLAGEKVKAGTPTMGGIIIILALVIPTILLTDVKNVYIILMLLCTLWLGAIGFLDDYLKKFRKNKDGLAGKYKVVGQLGLGIIIGATMYFSDNVNIVRETTGGVSPIYSSEDKVIGEEYTRIENGKTASFVKVRSAVTTIPFAKDHELSYAKIASFFGEGAVKYLTPLFYILLVTFIIIAVSNGANLTDGIDGLATGTSAIMGICLGVFVYVSGNYYFSEYLNIMYIPNLGEVSIFVAAFVGACIGFLWYNSFPAQVFMGDTGSLALGGIIATLAVIVRKELLVPIICGIFLIENVSVMIQVGVFKYTKKKYGEGRRVFLMTPLHHHYQKLGYHESKISTRFWIVGILLAVLSIVTLKLQ